VAAPELLERGGSIREQIARRISANYHRLLEKVARPTSPPPCRVLAAEGGWSAVLEVPSFEAEEPLVLALLQDESVLAHPGYFFDFPRESYLIVSLLVDEARFDDGTDRLLKRLDCPIASHE
jgi:hypothetical protein